MSQTTELLLRIKQQGGEQLTRLSGSFKNLGQQAAAANVNFKEVSDELRKIQQSSANSINNLKGYANAWREIANSVEIGTAEFKQANAEAAKLEAQLKKVQPGGGTGRLMGLARGAGTVAAAGVFGGPLGAVGALAGAPFGLAGMAAGGAIGAQAGMMGQQVAGLASYTASIERQRTALKLVTEDSVSYQQALDFINTTSQRLAIPQEQITRQFTQLSASVLGAGGNVRDAEKAFLGIAAGIRGTGGSLQDMEAALRATAQVFSKGKVSAEELRQQIGERLPGAFTLFAKSVGMTPQELDKALEDGKVSLQDFQKFAEELFKRYGKSAEIIAQGPQSAGDRLQASLSKLSESVGRLLAPIGAAFQTIFADIVNAITRAANALARFMGMKFYDPERIADLEKRIKGVTADLAGPTDSMTARRCG
jgi:tape measure domain-containing protein